MIATASDRLAVSSAPRTGRNTLKTVRSTLHSKRLHKAAIKGAIVSHSAVVFFSFSEVSTFSLVEASAAVFAVILHTMELGEEGE